MTGSILGAGPAASTAVDLLRRCATDQVGRAARIDVTRDHPEFERTLFTHLEEAREALLSSTWSRQPRHALGTATTSRTSRGSFTPGQTSCSPRAITQLLEQAQAMARTATGTFLWAGLHKLRGDHAALEGRPLEARASHTIAIASYQELLQEPLTARRRAAVLAAVADLNCRHLARAACADASRACDLAPDWIYPRVVLLVAAIAEQDLVLAPRVSRELRAEFDSETRAHALATVSLPACASPDDAANHQELIDSKHP